MKLNYNKIKINNMKILKKMSLLTLLSLNAVSFNACGNSNSANNQVNSNAEVKQSTLLNQQSENSYQTSQKSTLGVQTKLDKAKKEGKAVFVVVTGNEVTNTAQATTIAKGANEIYKNAVIVQMNRDDVANASLVNEWRLSGAPLPLILAISPNGTLTGGYILKQATAENIAALIPSPKMEMVYEAVKNKKYSVVVFSKKSFTDKNEVVKIAKNAVSQLKDEAVFIEVDMDDENETSFINKLRINKSNVKSSVTVVINKQGQLAGTSTTIPDAEKLVKAAKTPIKSGCGPGCGPSGCGK